MMRPPFVSRARACHRRIAIVAAAAALVTPGPGLAAQAVASARPTAGQLTLVDAIATAQRQGMSARAAEQARDASRWRARSFSARRLPQIGLAGSMPSYNRAIGQVVQPDGTTQFRAQTEMQSEFRLQLTQPIPWTGGSLFTSSRLNRLDHYGDDPNRLWQSSPVLVGISQPIFRPNVLAWDRREQDIQSDVAERQYVESREDVALATVAAFFQAYAARVSLENASTNVAVNDTLYTLSKGRFEVGKIGENDLLQSELALLKARTSVDDSRLNYDRALAQLRLQLDLPPGTPVDVAVPTTIPSVHADTLRAVSEALRNRRQIRDLDLQDVQARRRINEARLENGFGATVTASAGLNQSGAGFGDVYRSPLNSQQFRLEVQMPLVQWGARHADIEAARADRERVAATSRASRESIAQEAHFAALRLDLARRQLELSAKADWVAATRFEVAKNRYVIGKIGIDNLYLAQNEKDAAVQGYVQALNNYWTAYYQLRRTTLFDFSAGQAIR
jgi:outer membrane protein TolC